MSRFKSQEQELLANIERLRRIQCGEEAAKHFALDAGYKNLNHGAYGTYPLAIRHVLRFYQEAAEARPDTFVRYEYRTRLLSESREVIAKYLHAPVETCVYVPNATTGIDTVLRNLVFKEGDVIVCFDSLYPAFDNTGQHLAETSPVELKKIGIRYPVSDEYVCHAFESTIKELRNTGKNPRIAIFDTINSLPGLRMPFERLTKLCRSYNIFSCIDGAHGAGHIPLHLSELDPDFFVSNLHKWLYVPRGCAVLYVPTRNQHLMRSTFPSGYGYAPLRKGDDTRDSNFVENFAYVGTRDDTSYLCVSAALEWRSKLQWAGKQGEEAIMAYIQELVRKGGQTVSEILSTEVLENEEGSLGRCNFTNVRLPLSVAEFDAVRPEEIGSWITKKMNLQYQTALNAFFYLDAWWVRLDAQVYLTLRDFEYAGEKLKTTCELAKQGNWEINTHPALM